MSHSHIKEKILLMLICQCTATRNQSLRNRTCPSSFTFQACPSLCSFSSLTPPDPQTTPGQHRPKQKDAGLPLAPTPPQSSKRSSLSVCRLEWQGQFASKSSLSSWDLGTRSHRIDGPGRYATKPWSSFAVGNNGRLFSRDAPKPMSEGQQISRKREATGNQCKELLLLPTFASGTAYTTHANLGPGVPVLPTRSVSAPSSTVTCGAKHYLQ